MEPNQDRTGARGNEAGPNGINKERKQHQQEASENRSITERNPEGTEPEPNGSQRERSRPERKHKGGEFKSKGSNRSAKQYRKGSNGSRHLLFLTYTFIGALTLTRGKPKGTKPEPSRSQRGPKQNRRGAIGIIVLSF